MSLFVKDNGLPDDKPKESATVPPGDVGDPDADPHLMESETSPAPTPTENLDRSIEAGEKENKGDLGRPKEALD
jgi:hypothetical protein